jgi:tetratricopeptide (TPR) repeat protein
MNELKYDLKKGDIINDRFEIQGTIVNDKIGTVYLVKNLNNGIFYALKNYIFYQENSKLTDLFRKAVEKWLKLGFHPNIIELIYVENFENRLYLVLELIKPKLIEKVTNRYHSLITLYDYLKYDPPDLKQILKYCIQICYGMEYAHKTLLHLNLNPQNIFISENIYCEKIAKIIDFGLGYTPGYAAPEIYENKPEKRSDIYSLGVIMYHLINNDFENEYYKMVKTNQNFLIIRKLNNILDNVIEKCTQKELKMRYDSFSEIKYEIEKLLYEIYNEKVSCPDLQNKLPEDAELLNYGVNLFNLGFNDQALEYFTRVINLQKKSTQIAYYNLGKVYDKLGDYEKAIYNYDRIINFDNNKELTFNEKEGGYFTDIKKYSIFKAITFNQKGITLIQLKRYNKAIECFLKAIELINDFSQAYFNLAILAIVNEKLENFDDALDYYDKAIKFKNNYSDAYYNKGSLLYKLGKSQEAIESLEKAVQIYPRFTRAYYNLGIVYGHSNLDNDALNCFLYYIELFNKELDDLNDLTSAFFNAGISFGNLKMFDEEIDCYLNAIKIKPDYAEAYFRIGFTYNEINLTNESIDYYEKAIELKPDFVDAYINCALSYSKLHRYEKSIIYLDKAIEYKPDYAYAYHNRACLFGSMGELEKALKDYDKAIFCSNDFADAYYYRGIVKKNLNDLIGAILDWQKAYELGIKDAKEFIDKYYTKNIITQITYL